MKDTPDEIASIMNLILPESEKLPIKDEFMSEFFIKQKTGTDILNPKTIATLKNKFKGRVSYLNSMQTDIKKIFEGKKIGTLNHFKVKEDVMSAFQTEIYNNAYKRDEEEKGVYSFSRQAILFVFPDGTYGQEGFNQEKYIKKSSLQKNTKVNYVIGKDLYNKIHDTSHDKMLQNISNFSSKYSATIKNILDAKKSLKSCFVYCEFVTGSGAILFSLLLSLFGFSKATGSEKTKESRYYLVTNLTSSQKQIQRVINRFNQPDNMNGEFINVIIGSKVIGEGFSLKNIQLENILTPHWFLYNILTKSYIVLIFILIQYKI